MDHMCVVFSIGEDIVNKLKSLHQEEIMDFVLGFSDNDYFGEHFLAIEELHYYWRKIFHFFVHLEENSIYFLKYGQVLTDRDSHTILILKDTEDVQNIIKQLEKIEPIKMANLYSHCLKKENIETSDLSFIDFICFLECIKKLCKEALNENGSLLFSIGCSYIPLV